MERKLVFVTFLAILLTNLLGMAIKVEKVKASGTIYIRADGSIDPSTANITSVDNVTYIFTGNIYDSIVVERDNILLDGQGYLLQGTGIGSGYGITLYGRSNVTLRNIEINTFYVGVWLNSSSNNTVSGNYITNNNEYGVFLYASSNYNTVSGNNITANGYTGVYLSSSSDNTISGNNITNNVYGVRLYYSTSNIIYHNNFANNLLIWLLDSINNAWDNGCEGNFWSDFAGSDSNGDGIGDTPYVITGGNQDNYPLMNPYWNPADINHDLKVDIYDVVLACAAYSSTPSDMNWNCHCDVADPYGIINIFDIVMICSSYGEEY